MSLFIVGQFFGPWRGKSFQTIIRGYREAQKGWCITQYRERKVTWTLKSMFVRTGRWWSGCGGLKLFPSGAFGWSLSPCINCRNARSCKGWNEYHKTFLLFSCIVVYPYILFYSRMKPWWYPRLREDWDYGGTWIMIGMNVGEIWSVLFLGTFCFS